MTTTINHNGSRFAGGRPAPVSALLEILKLERAADLSGFERLPNGMTRFMGNFERISHAFSIDSDDPGLLKAFRLALKASRRLASRLDGPADDSMTPELWALMSSQVNEQDAEP